MKKKYFLLASVILAVLTVVGSYFLIMKLVSPTEFYVNTVQFNKGQLLDPLDETFKASFEKKTIYSQLPFDAVTDLSQISNTYVVSDLPPGTVLTKNLFSNSENVSAVREGYTMLSIQVDSYMSLEEGDVVNLVGMWSDNYGVSKAKILARNVRCLGVYNKASKSIKVLKNSKAASYEDLSPYKVVLETPVELMLTAEQFEHLYVYTVNPNDVSELPSDYVQILENTSTENTENTEVQDGN